MTVSTGLGGNGTITNQANSTLTLESNADVSNAITNQSGAFIEVTGDATADVVMSATSAVVDVGTNTFSVTSLTNSGNTNITITNSANGSISASGIVDLNNGTLNLSAAGISSGSWVVARGSAVEATNLHFNPPATGQRYSAWEYTLVPTNAPTELVVDVEILPFISFVTNGLYIQKVAKALDAVDSGQTNAGQAELLSYFFGDQYYSRT